MRGFKHWAPSAVFLPLVIVACRGEPLPPQANASDGPQKNEATALGQDANAQPGDSFAYNAQNKRDPFRSYLVEVSERRNNEQKGRAREETEKFEITDYRLTGLMTGISQPKAMVEDPSGRGHVVRIGTRLGRNNGRVTTIAPHGIQVTEDAVDPLGRHQRNTIDVPLPQTAVDADSSP